MSKYTVAQVMDEITLLSSVPDGDTASAMLRDYAALLRERESAKLPEGLRERIERAWHDHDEDGRVSISMADAKMLVEQVLVEAPMPDKPECLHEWAIGYGIADYCKKCGIPKPEKE